MLETNQQTAPALDPGKFNDPNVTAKGEQRAVVALTHLKTLWFNTGSLCNIECNNCYMDSNPKNDSLAYLSAREVEEYLDEIHNENLPVEEIAFTGGEPFMNKDLIRMLEVSLQRGYRALILTNAMKPLHHRFEELASLNTRFGNKLTIRVSIDHFKPFNTGSHVFFPRTASCFSRVKWSIETLIASLFPKRVFKLASSSNR